MESNELQELVEAAKRRDETAFAALTRAHYRLIYSLAYSTVGDWSAAQDIAQDTFLVAWTHLGNIRHAGAFPMWIRKIARNLALNWIRSAEYRRKLAERHEQLAEPRTTDPDAAANALDHEARCKAMWSAVQLLSSPVREALVLFYLEGRSVTEAASQLGISENAFKLRLHTGRARLRKIYEQQVEESLQRDLSVPNTDTATSRILAGLAMGPALPMTGKSVAGAGASLWLHHLAHGGASDLIAPVLKGGLVVNVNKATIATVAAVAICLGGAYWATTRQPNFNKQSGENWRRAGKIVPTVSDDATTGESSSNSTRQLTKAADQYTAQANTTTTPDPTPKAQKDLEASGDMTASAALLLSMEKGKIADPKEYASISGVVIDTHGSPVPKATVQVFMATGSDFLQGITNFLAARQNPAHSMTAVADASGRFIVEGISYEGNAALTAMADGYSMKERGNVRVPVKPGDQISNVRITLEPGKGLYGKLIAPDGKPVPDGVVNVVAYRSRAESPNGTLANTNTDAMGTFRFAFPREGVVSLVTSSLKYGGASFDEVPVGTDEVIELQMPKAARLTGTITWAKGGAASDVLVFLTGQANDGRGQRRVPASVYAAKTDSSGNYTIDSIDTNQSYMASVSKLDQTALSQPEKLPDFVSGSTQTWNYAIQELIYVRGHVLGETTGQPLRDIKVGALKDGRPVENSDIPVQADGSYELRLSSGPGNYTIYPRLWRIEPQITGYKYGKPLALVPGQDATLDLTFIDTATMSIRVVDASDQPMKGITLGIHEGDHTWGPLAQTPADGRFTWAGFMPGVESNFVVMGTTNDIGNTQPISAEPGQVYPEETVVIYGSAGIEATATKPNGEPLANGVVMVHASYALTRQVERRVNTDDTGHFVIDAGLPATGVILEIDGYTESGSGVDKFEYVSDELTLLDKEVMDLGTLQFSLKEAGVTIEP